MICAVQARILEPEVMDDPALDASEHRRALRGLSRLNRLGRADSILWSALSDLARDRAPRRVLDVACGGGDVTVALARRARAAAAPFEWRGCDRSALAIEHARDAARCADAAICFERRDVLRDGLPAGFDIILCSLFLHHLDDATARQLLRNMADAATTRVVVSDLKRSRATRLIVRCAASVASRSSVVRTDSDLSGRAAFTPAEAARLAADAGLAGAKIVPRFPCRWILIWSRA
jgi:SAM-dependent methyltransferase